MTWLGNKCCGILLCNAFASMCSDTHGLCCLFCCASCNVLFTCSGRCSVCSSACSECSELCVFCGVLCHVLCYAMHDVCCAMGSAVAQRRGRQGSCCFFVDKKEDVLVVVREHGGGCQRGDMPPPRLEVDARGVTCLRLNLNQKRLEHRLPYHHGAHATLP